MIPLFRQTKLDTKTENYYTRKESSSKLYIAPPKNDDPICGAGNTVLC